MPSLDGTASQPLKRELGIWGAVMMGMGSIVGTGVFVSLGIGAGIARLRQQHKYQAVAEVYLPAIESSAE